MDQTKNDRRENFLRDEYISRINRVVDYIELNIDKELSLERLASVANFSRFHFHRIFKAIMGETLNRYIQRIRLERAASQLIGNPKKTITEVAYDCGFSGSAPFARAFKDYFKMSASRWRKEGSLYDGNIGKDKSKDGKAISKIRQDIEVASQYIEDTTQNRIWRITMVKKPDFQVEVKDMPELYVAYVRHIGPYKGDSELFEGLFNRLMSWAGPRDLLRFPETQVLAVYHDDPKVTDEEKLKTSACITVPKDTPVDGEVGYMTIPAGKYAAARFELAVDEYEDAWDSVFGAWLPESGYQPDDGPTYELYLNDPKEHPENKCIVDIVIPVKPL
jgi:AraC family transcriptional regulator